MKTLANCTPREFLKQTNRIRIAVEKWLDATKILEIREKMPEFPEPKKPESKEELTNDIETRNKLVAEQMRKNGFAMLEAMLDTNMEETLELIALVCFIEPEDIDNYKMSDLFSALAEVMNDESVIGFFASVARLVG